jgi:DNA-directed RNA polymerase specialized sigma24 family protein
LLIFMGTEAHGPSPDELVVQADAATRLREAVKRLPAEQRRAVVKAYFYGQTAQDISTSEGIPLGTAKTRIRAGMTKLRAATLEEAEAAKRGANG